MPRYDDYKFLEIVDARASIDQRVNLIGLVLETSIPKQSKGTDYVCTMKIIDESYSTHGLTVNVFAENVGKLPHVESAGDIIQFTRLMMKINNGDIYAVFHKRYSSFALYEGRYGTSFVAYEASPNFHPRDQDKKFIDRLRKWSADNQLDGGRSQPLSLKEIKAGGELNMMCKVLHVCESTNGKWMAFVWDGTDTPPATFQNKPEDEMKNPLPLQSEPFTLSRDILCTFPPIGTVLRVIIDQDNDKFDLHSLKTGRWVIFVNFICELDAGLWRGVLVSTTKLRYLSADDSLVIQAQRDYDGRFSSKWKRMPLSSFPWCPHITETDYEGVPLVTLMNVLTYPEVTAKFKCVVRVVAVLPWRAEDFLSPIGKYRVRLTLEDPTARIHAFLYGEDGKKFFDGHPSVEVLKRKQNTLLGIGTGKDEEIKDAPRNPPWIECCIKSYYLVETDVWGSRRYGIFGTKVR